MKYKNMSSMWLVTTISLVFMIALTVVIACQSINAVKVQDANFLNIGYTIGPICNNDNKLCYKNTTQEEIEVAEKNYEPTQMAKKSDLHNETISAIQAAETRKKVYEEGLSENQNGSWKVMTGTLDSVPEIHTDRLPTEHHEIAIILPPNVGKIYEGVIAYSASRDVQPGSLYGPVNLGEEKGQLVSSMDGGKTLYAVTTKNADQTTGTWQFAGNVLVVHAPEYPFTVNYTVVFREAPLSKANKVETVQSIPSTLLGNSSNEQVVMIIPPTTTREDRYSGTLSYTATKNVQLVVFHGPLRPDEYKEQRIWSPDNGKTRYALTLVEPGNSMGNFVFSGNGLAIHALSNKVFTTSYAVVVHK